MQSWQKNSCVLTGAADQQSKNHILQKELYLHNATGQTNQQQSLLRSCSFSALREAACGVHQIRSLNSSPIRIVASFGSSRYSLAFARYAEPTTATLLRLWTARCPLHTIGVYLIGRHLCWQAATKLYLRNYLPNLKSRPIPQAIDVRL